MDALTLPRTCKRHGEHEDWSVRKPHGAHKTPYLRCRPCDRERQRAAEQKAWRVESRRKAWARQGAFRKNAYRAAVYASLLDHYGPVAADAYRVASEAGAKRIDVRRILRGVIAAAHPGMSNAQVTRALKLNEIAKHSLTNTRWQCAECSIESSDTGFFDIDHIVPCAALGKRSYADNSNLQLLCPNCHRCKTMNLAKWYEVGEESRTVAA